MITTLRKSDISRMVGRILGKDARSAAHGWDVYDTGTQVFITLNHITRDADRAAFEEIREALGDRYRLHYTPALTGDEYEHMPADYDGCGVVDIIRKETPVPQEQTPAPAAAPTVSVTLPEPFCSYLDMLPMIDNDTPEGDDEEEFVNAYRSATPVKNKHSTSQKITTSNTRLLATLAALADECMEVNSDDRDRDEDVAAEYNAAAQVAQRARTALTKLRTALAAHKEQQTAQEAPQKPQEAPTPAQETQERPQAAQGPVSVWVTTQNDERIEYAHIPNGDPARVAHYLNAARNIPTYRDASTDKDPHQGPAPVTASVKWTKTLRGHHKGTMTFPNGTTYRITEFAHSRRAPGDKGDHLAETDQGFKITWGLDALAATLAEHAGYTGPVTIEQHGRHRLTTHRR